MTIRYKAVVASCIFFIPLIASAEQGTIYQDCLLEGKVIADKQSDGTNTVRIDFYKAQPYKPGARCIIDGVLEFKLTTQDKAQRDRIEYK